MDFLVQSLLDAVRLIFSFDAELFRICFVSVWIACTSTILASLAGVPLGIIIGSGNFYGKKPLIVILNTLMALPTVVVGLFVYSFLSRSGPFGDFGFLYTPIAMIIGQFILATPIITALTISAIENTDPRIKMTAQTLGASNWQTKMTILSEARFAVLAAVIAGFGRVFAEVGVSMMLGGNIKHYTRNITTAIALETGKGEFALGFALGIILLVIAFGINIVFGWLKTNKK